MKTIIIIIQAGFCFLLSISLALCHYNHVKSEKKSIELQGQVERAIKECEIAQNGWEKLQKSY